MQSTVKPRLQDSTMKWPARPQRLPKDAPNILIVLLDDVGFGVADKRWVRAASSRTIVATSASRRPS
jgi:hypothetical protein